MDLKTLLTADYLDIIFDKRNKEYGGYELRKHYNRRMGKAFGTLLLGVAAFCSFSFVTTKAVGIVPPNVRPVTPTDINPPILPPKPPVVVPPAPAPPKQLRTIHITPPVIAPDDKVVDKQLPKKTDVHDMQPGPTDADGDDSPDITIGTPKKGGTGTSVIGDQPAPPKPVLWVQQMPQFGGDLGNYISSHLHYPDAARAAGIEGRVVVRFVVNEDGSISDATIERGIGGGCDEEALRMVRSMPNWKPGKQNGMAVKVYFSLPIKFVLQ